MRNLFILILLVFMSASSFAFYVSGNVVITGKSAEAVVHNQWKRPILCSGVLKAIDAGGSFINEWMNNIVILPGQQAYMNAFAHGKGNYLRDAGAKVNCHWY